MTQMVSGAIALDYKYYLLDTVNHSIRFGAILSRSALVISTESPTARPITKATFSFFLGMAKFIFNYTYVKYHSVQNEHNNEKKGCYEINTV